MGSDEVKENLQTISDNIMTKEEFWAAVHAASAHVTTQLEALAEQEEQIRIRTQEKLTEFANAVQTHLLHAQEAAQRKATAVKENWNKQAQDWLQKCEEKFQKNQEKLADVRAALAEKFETMELTGEKWAAEVEQILKNQVAEMNEKMIFLADYMKDAKEKFEVLLAGQYKKAKANAKELGKQLTAKAEEFENLVVARANAGREIAEVRYQELK